MVPSHCYEIDTNFVVIIHLFSMFVHHHHVINSHLRVHLIQKATKFGDSFIN